MYKTRRTGRNNDLTADTDRQTDRRTGRPTDRQTGNQAGRQADWGNKNEDPVSTKQWCPHLHGSQNDPELSERIIGPRLSRRPLERPPEELLSNYDRKQCRCCRTSPQLKREARKGGRKDGRKEGRKDGMLKIREPGRQETRSLRGRQSV